MNNLPRVKHPTFPPDSLHGHRLAYCEDGTHFPCNIRVENLQTDGSYQLVMWWMNLVYPSDPEATITGQSQEALLDQETVNKIVKPEFGSLLHQMSYPFAIVRDSESEYLAKKY